MTNEEALSLCNLALKCIGNLHSDFPNKELVKEIASKHDIEVIIEALEKQIPKKVKTFPHENNIIKSVYCPCCNKRFKDKWKGACVIYTPKFCSECGQALDWSE